MCKRITPRITICLIYTCKNRLSATRSGKFSNRNLICESGNKQLADVYRKWVIPGEINHYWV